jgi:hypothetical protein
MDKPLTGLKVVELARILAGPWAGQLLADLGADVVKVERPGTGDDTRQWGPPFAPDGAAAYFHACNRGKRSLAIDIATAEGQAQVRALASEADVLIENFKVGGLPATASIILPSQRSIPASSTARSPASARTDPMHSGPATISSSRPWAAPCR